MNILDTLIQYHTQAMFLARDVVPVYGELANILEQHPHVYHTRIGYSLDGDLPALYISWRGRDTGGWRAVARGLKFLPSYTTRAFDEIVLLNQDFEPPRSKEELLRLYLDLQTTKQKIYEKDIHNGVSPIESVPLCIQGNRIILEAGPLIISPPELYGYEVVVWTAQNENWEQPIHNLIRHMTE